MSPDDLYQRVPAWAQTLLLNAHALRISAYRRGAPYRAAVALLAESERWPAERLRAWQDARLREVIRTAYTRSPYYRGVMDTAGILPRDVRGVADLARLPLLEKETVRTQGRELWTAPRPARSWAHGHTSGTTGSPLSLWYSRNTCVMNDAADHRQKAWGGLRDGEWIGLFLGRVTVSADVSRPPFWRANAVHRQLWFSSFHLCDGNLPRYVDEIRRRGLRFLEGYPSTLHILARYLVRRGETLPMRAVFTSSETLHQLQREAMEAAFGCAPFDFYGHAERALFATGCEAREKHLCEEYGVAEAVDDDGRPVPDGAPGWLVGTSLHNTAMPMLRYRTGDRTAIRRERCVCGRTLARIERVTTKAEDIVVTPDGRMISPSVLTHPFKPFPQIRESQLVQEDAGRLMVLVVAGDDLSRDDERTLVAQLTARLGGGMEIELRRVDAISRERSEEAAA
jgi:phenylacetate-CoA ligase